MKEETKIADILTANEYHRFETLYNVKRQTQAQQLVSLNTTTEEGLEKAIKLKEEKIVQRKVIADDEHFLTFVINKIGG